MSYIQACFVSGSSIAHILSARAPGPVCSPTPLSHEWGECPGPFLSRRSRLSVMQIFEFRCLFVAVFLDCFFNNWNTHQLNTRRKLNSPEHSWSRVAEARFAARSSAAPPLPRPWGVQADVRIFMLERRWEQQQQSSEGARVIKTGTVFVTPLLPALFMRNCKADVRECRCITHWRVGALL